MKTFQNVIEKHLKTIEKIAETNFRSLQKKKIASGGQNIVSLASISLESLSEKKETEENKKTKNSIAIIQSKRSDDLEKNKHVLSLLSENKIDSPFIQSYLYVSQDLRIDEVAKCDLETFISTERDKIKDETLKSIVGQLILGLETLHDKQLVHRDIKPLNILVYDYNGNTQVKISDLDTICKLASKNEFYLGELLDENICLNQAEAEYHCDFYPPLAYTKNYCAPEVSDKTNFYVGQYEKANKKLLDIFALGITLGQLYFGIDIRKIDTLEKKLSEHKKEDQASLISLIHYLISDVKKRPDIKKIKEHCYFGKTSEDRAQFFYSLKETFSQKTSLTSYELPKTVDYNDFFYVTPQLIQDLHIFLQDIKNKLNIINLNDKDELSALNIKLISLQKLLDDILKSDDLISYHHEAQFIQENLVESFSNLTADKLKTSVIQAVALYRDQTFSFFHGKKGKEQAISFLVKIMELSNIEDIHTQIKEHIKNGPGNHYPSSFKTLLKNNLNILSVIELENWDIFFKKKAAELPSEKNSSSKLEIGKKSNSK